jgi:hypothetical protein
MILIVIMVAVSVVVFSASLAGTVLLAPRGLWNNNRATTHYLLITIFVFILFAEVAATDRHVFL